MDEIDYNHELEAARHLARSVGLPFVDLRAYRISPGILRKLPRRVAARYRCVPMVYNARRVVLVHDDPAPALLLSVRPALAGLADLAGPVPVRALEFALTTKSGIDETLARRMDLPDRD